MKVNLEYLQNIIVKILLNIIRLFYFNISIKIKYKMSRTIYVCYTAELHNSITEYAESFIQAFDAKILITNMVYNYNNCDVYLFIQRIPDMLLLNPIKNMYLINISQLTVPECNYMITEVIEKKIKVIDYSVENIKILGTDILHLPYQYTGVEIENLKNYIDHSEKGYDVVIYGCLTPRVKYIYDELVKRNIKVLHLENIWNSKRDIRMSTAKLLLNVHLDDTGMVHESLWYDRWVLAGMLFISEESLYNNILDIKELVIFEKYENLVSKIVDIINNYCSYYIQFIDNYNNNIDMIRTKRENALNNVYNDIIIGVNNDNSYDIQTNKLEINKLEIDKLEDSTIEILSANWRINGGHQSFIKLADNNIVLRRGYNLFGVKGKSITTLAVFDGCVDDQSEMMQTYIKNTYDKVEYDHLIIVTHDDVTNKMHPRIIHNYLIFLGCKKLKNLQFRGSYVLIYNLKDKSILFESCENKYPIHEWFELVKNDDSYDMDNLGPPVYLIVYNLLFFTKRSVEQLKSYTKNIHIIDNKSTYPKLLDYYDTEYKYFLHKMSINHGHNVWRKEMFWQFPKYFAITDPDLEFNKNLPSDFLFTLKTLSDEYQKGKVGFALDLSDAYLFYQDSSYMDLFTIENWEKQFWINKIDNTKYDLYDAQIDTTFCMINKEFLNEQNALDGLRIAGDFVCKHTPWYEDWYKMLEPDEWKFYKENNISSSTLRLIEKIQETNNNKNALLFKNVDKMIVNMGEFIPKLDQLDDTDVVEIQKNMNNCMCLLLKYKVKLSNMIIEKTKT